MKLPKAKREKVRIFLQNHGYLWVDGLTYGMLAVTPVMAGRRGQEPYKVRGHWTVTGLSHGHAAGEIPDYCHDKIAAMYWAVALQEAEPNASWWSGIASHFVVSEEGDAASVPIKFSPKEKREIAAVVKTATATFRRAMTVLAQKVVAESLKGEEGTDA